MNHPSSILPIQAGNLCIHTKSCRVFVRGKELDIKAGSMSFCYLYKDFDGRVEKGYRIISGLPLVYKKFKYSLSPV